MAHNRGEEFDAPFARVDRVGPDSFDIYWMRHTGKWWPLHAGATFADALGVVNDSLGKQVPAGAWIAASLRSSR